MNRIRLVEAIGYAAAVLGIVYAAFTLHGSGDQVRRIERRQADIRAIREMTETLPAWERMQAALPELNVETARALEPLLRDMLPGAPYRVQMNTRLPVGEGWELREADVSIDQIALGTLGGMLQTLEALRPPWRLTACRIVPIQTRPDAARVNLTLASLQPVEDGS